MLPKLKNILILASFALNCVHAETFVSIPQGEYELIAKTLLPHLQENLSNTITKEKRCLNQVEINTLFPILNHPSFYQCGLLPHADNEITYDLRCENSSAATGQAQLLIETKGFSAILKIKMGAKNMTMVQTVDASKIDNCELIN